MERTGIERGIRMTVLGVAVTIIAVVLWWIWILKRIRKSLKKEEDVSDFTKSYKAWLKFKDQMIKTGRADVLLDIIGKTKQKRFDEEWLNTRTQVLQRDNYKCVNCGQTGEELHVHHIIPKSEGGTEDLDNLVTLCAKCHSTQKSKGHDLINSRIEDEDYDAYADEMDEE